MKTKKAPATMDKEITQAIAVVVAQLEDFVHERGLYATVNEWERDAWGHAVEFHKARKHSDREGLVMATGSLCGVIAEQLIAGNYNALHTIADGMNNLAKGNSFKASPGPKRSKDKERVMTSIALLQASGIPSPSQLEVRTHLADRKHNISRAQVQAIFDSLGLNTEESDTRRNDSAAAKRKKSRKRNA